jgi:hypothetical protein
MTPTDYPYLHVARATDLTGKDRRLYRALEILPGTLSLGTLVGITVLAATRPAIAAYVTILFSSFWLFKTVFLSVHLQHNFKRLRHAMETDWVERLANLKYDQIVHLVILPFYRESYAVIEESVRALESARFPQGQIMVVLAGEERAGEEARETAERAKRELAEGFFDFVTTTHPQGLSGEIPGKGSNIAYAAREAAGVLTARDIAWENVIVSAFDVDTVAYPDYFPCLTWHYLTAENPLRASFQPVPLFNNNIWSAPMLSRVLAYSSTFWQMTLQERPERLATFSSHAVSLKTLAEAGYWQPNVVSEDSRIFWNLFIFYAGEYEVVPLSYPVSMDANVARGFFRTIANLYRQHRRWGYGVENVPYILFNFIKSPGIPLGKKMKMSWIQVEGFWSLATHPLVLFVFGWLPLFIGGHAFNTTVLSYNLPIIARWFLTFSMLGLIGSAVFCAYLVPQLPSTRSRWRRVPMVVQWVLVPFTMVTFSAIPGLEAQIRLMLGRYLGFWVTPKSREGA